MRWQHKSFLKIKAVFILRSMGQLSFSLCLTFYEDLRCLGNVLSFSLTFCEDFRGLGNVPCTHWGLVRERKTKLVRLTDISVLLLHRRRHTHTFCWPVLRTSGSPAPIMIAYFQVQATLLQPCNAGASSSALSSQSHMGRWFTMNGLQSTFKS